MHNNAVMPPLTPAEALRLAQEALGRIPDGECSFIIHESTQCVEIVWKRRLEITKSRVSLPIVAVMQLYAGILQMQLAGSSVAQSVQ